MRARLTVVMVMMLLLSALVIGCGAQPTPETIVETVVETVIVEKEGETVVETVVVEKEVEVVVTATPEEEAMAEDLPPAPEYIEFGASIPMTGKFGSRPIILINTRYWLLKGAT